MSLADFYWLLILNEYANAFGCGASGKRIAKQCVFSVPTFPVTSFVSILRTRYSSEAKYQREQVKHHF